MTTNLEDIIELLDETIYPAMTQLEHGIKSKVKSLHFNKHGGLVAMECYNSKFRFNSVDELNGLTFTQYIKDAVKDMNVGDVLKIKKSLMPAGGRKNMVSRLKHYFGDKKFTTKDGQYYFGSNTDFVTSIENCDYYYITRIK